MKKLHFISNKLGLYFTNNNADLPEYNGRISSSCNDHILLLIHCKSPNFVIMLVKCLYALISFYCPQLQQTIRTTTKIDIKTTKIQNKVLVKHRKDSDPKNYHRYLILNVYFISFTFYSLSYHT